uniref:Uncharacterized protein n=1 Tax=Anguilla anguilla TaxID=7936 RepID=A0A0E9VIS4_ANGAN
MRFWNIPEAHSPRAAELVLGREV